MAKQLRNVEENMATYDDVDRIEIKLVKIDDRLERCGMRLDNHEKSINKLESKVKVFTS